MQTNKVAIVQMIDGYAGTELVFSYVTPHEVPKDAPIGEVFKDSKNIFTIILTTGVTNKLIQYTLDELGGNHAEIGKIESYKSNYKGTAYVWQEPFHAWAKQQNQCKERIEKLKTQLANLYHTLYMLENT